MNNKLKKLAVLGVSAVMVGSVAFAAGCGPKKPAEAGDRTVIMYQAANMDTNISSYYTEMVKAYNDTQGITDNVYVQLIPSSSDVGGLENSLISNYQYDIVQIADDKYKSLVLTGREFFVELDQYLTDEVKDTMGYGYMSSGLTNRFCMNQKTESNKKYYTGEGTATLGLPVTNAPNVLWYNVSTLKNCGINVVSVSEDELEAYNTANSATLMPHGYAEYKQAPFSGAKSSRNEAGDFVYKVFNNRIAMNWEETRCLSRAFMKQYNYEAGYLAEWWFNYGWSVGGDCIGWNTETDAYEFTLADDQSNYLALDSITVNGRAYSAGDVLLYEDKAKINSDSGLKSSLDGKVYELPSQRDAILEFNRLAVPVTKQADTGIYGYGVSSDSLDNRTSKFTSGKVPLYIEDINNSLSFSSSMNGNVDVAPVTQYREFVDGSTYQKDGESGFENEYLKVIGEEYDGKVYTGELKEENGTAITGRCISSSKAYGLFIPKNTRNKNYEAASKFIVWAAGPEAQKILAKSGVVVPNQSNLGMGECAEYENRVVNNVWAASYVAQNSEIGDFTYFTSETWITEWSVTFNTSVRRGDMTLTSFLNHIPPNSGTGLTVLQIANAALKNQRLRIIGR